MTIAEMPADRYFPVMVVAFLRTNGVRIAFVRGAWPLCALPWGQVWSGTFGLLGS